MTTSLDDLLARGRAAHLDLMLDTCTITRAGTSALNRTTSALTPGAATTLYSGACRVKAQRLPRDRQAGERLTSTARYEVALPFTAVPTEPLQVGDRVTVTASADARLIGQAMAVKSLDYGSTATAWRLTVEDVT